GVKNWDDAAADWSRAAAGNPEGAKWLAEFARRLAAAGQVSLAKSQFEKARALYERTLGADPENQLVAAELAHVLIDKTSPAEPDWVVLKPAETKTQSGAKLTLQDDGSILVEAAPNTDQQTVRWQPGPQPVEVIRIETSTRKVPPTDGAPFFNEYQALAA